MAKKGQFCCFWAKMPILGILGRFWPPRGRLDPSRGGCFYINPSRRGPVAPPGRVRDASPAQGRGRSPKGGLGGLPLGERSGDAAAPASGCRGPRLVIVFSGHLEGIKTKTNE